MDEDSSDSLWSESSEADSTDTPEIVRDVESSEEEQEEEHYFRRGTRRPEARNRGRNHIHREHEQSETAEDQIWLIRQGKRGRTEPANQPNFKRFVTELVRKELGTSPEGLTDKIQHRQMLSRYCLCRLVAAIMQADGGFERKDKRSIMKMRARIKMALYDQSQSRP